MSSLNQEAYHTSSSILLTTLQQWDSQIDTAGNSGNPNIDYPKLIAKLNATVTQLTDLDATVDDALRYFYLSASLAPPRLSDVPYYLATHTAVGEADGEECGLKELMELNDVLGEVVEDYREVVMKQKVNKKKVAAEEKEAA